MVYLLHKILTMSDTGKNFHMSTSRIENLSKGGFGIMTQYGLEIELMVAQETIIVAEKAFSKLRQDYHELRKHTDQLKRILKNITFHSLNFGAG